MGGTSEALNERSIADAAEKCERASVHKNLTKMVGVEEMKGGKSEIWKSWPTTPQTSSFAASYAARPVHDESLLFPLLKMINWIRWAETLRPLNGK